MFLNKDQKPKKYFLNLVHLKKIKIIFYVLKQKSQKNAKKR